MRDWDTGNLLQQAGDVEAAPVVQRAGFIGGWVGAQNLDRFGGMQNVPLQSNEIAAGAGQADALLRAEGLDRRHIPFKATGRDLDPNRDFHADSTSKRGHGTTKTLPNP